MGEEILIGYLSRNLAPSTILYGIFGTVFFTVGLVILFEIKKKLLASLTVVLYIAIWFLIWGPGWSVRVNDNHRNEALNANAAVVQKEYTSAKLYLKESAVDPGVWGEVKGSLGGFLFIGGNIYGKIDSGRVITVIYRQPDRLSINGKYAGKYLSFSRPLPDIVIETIPAGEKPYIMFPEAFVSDNTYNVKVYPEKPHLYLPEGWKIL